MIFGILGETKRPMILFSSIAVLLFTFSTLLMAKSLDRAPVATEDDDGFRIDRTA